MSTSSPYDQQPITYPTAPITIVLIVTLIIFFLAGFISIFLCKCFIQNIIHSLQLRNNPSGNLVGAAAAATTNHGLDPSLIQAFPTFAYSSVKDFRREKYGLECAICLAEFRDDSMLRLLTVCYHVFHQDCIDLWLESHKTCPVCRRDLNLPENTLEKSPVLVHRSNSMNDIISDNGSVLEDAVSIYIKEDGNDNDKEQGRRERDHEQGNISIKQEETWDQKLEKFTRSHSTGHSILPINKEDDKHTLRLPDQVRIRLLRGHHNWNRSCIPFGDYSSHRNNINGVFGEVAECSSAYIDDKV
ncbi:hypothetical protein Ddye_012266 [Dipteronia dyeriana]|uniref:RING-type E3 ubiquitin transferase n=1 Tax=Dipteronia dyeriana TaxID=168575 RepID=A0AAD9X402_9ROSI|nr:hypothetical protein Ddye_012266 [Dipteronia dyeriana]